MGKLTREEFRAVISTQTTKEENKIPFSPFLRAFKEAKDAQEGYEVFCKVRGQERPHSHVGDFVIAEHVSGVDGILAHAYTEISWAYSPASHAELVLALEFLWRREKCLAKEWAEFTDYTPRVEAYDKALKVAIGEYKALYGKNDEAMHHLRKLLRLEK